MPLTLSDVIDEPEATQLPEESDYDENEFSNDEHSKQAGKQEESEDIKNELAVPEIEKILKASPGKVDGLAKNLSLFDEGEEEMDDSHQPNQDKGEEKELDRTNKKDLTPLKDKFSSSKYTQSPLPNADSTMLQHLRVEEEEEEAFPNNNSPSFEMPFNTQQSQPLFSSKQDQSPVPSFASLSPKKRSPSQTEKTAQDADSYSDSGREDDDDEEEKGEEEEDDDDEEFANHPDPLRLDQISDQKLTRKDINRLKWWSYLIVLDKTDPTTWKLPYRDGIGRLNRPLLARVRFILTDQTLCSDMGLVLSKSVLAVAKRSFELCWPGQPVRLVRALDDNDEEDEDQVPMNPIQSTRSVLDEARALQKKLEKTSLAPASNEGNTKTKQQRSSAENGQQKVVEVESDVAPNLVMKIRERRRMAILGSTAGGDVSNNRSSSATTTASGLVLNHRHLGNANRFGMNRMVPSQPSGVIVGRKPTLNETKFQLLAAAKRKLAEVRQIKRQTDGEVDQGIVLTNPLTGQQQQEQEQLAVEQAPGGEEKTKKPTEGEEESDGEWTPEKGKDASSDSESEDESGSEEQSSSASNSDDDEEEDASSVGDEEEADGGQHKIDVEVVDEEEMGDQHQLNPTMPIESSQELASQVVVQQQEQVQKKSKTKKNKNLKKSEKAVVLIPETQDSQTEATQQDELPLALESSQEVFDPSSKNDKSDDNDDEDASDADEEDDDNDSNDDAEDSNSKQSESSQSSSKENTESNDNNDADKKQKTSKKKEDRNAQYRALLEQEARLAKRTKRSQYVENEAEEEEEEEQVGVYSIKEKVIGMKSDEEEEEVDENDLLRPTEDDLKHIVDTNSDDEGDNKAAQDLFQKQLDEKDEQMLKRVQRDLENHTFLNRRRKLLASGLEKALNDDDSDDETDEEIELAREKRFEEEMKKRMKEAQDQQMQGGRRKRVILGETIEEIELEQEQTKRFLEMARKLKRSASIPTPHQHPPSSSSSSSLLLGNKLQSSSILATVELDEDSKTVFESLRTSSSQPIMLEQEASSLMMTIETHSQSSIPIQRESSLPAFFSMNGVKRQSSGGSNSRCSFLGVSSRSTASSMTSNFVYTKRVKSIAPSMSMEDDDETARPPPEETTMASKSAVKSRVMPTMTMGTKRRIPLVPANKLPSAKLLALTSTVEPSSSSSSRRM